MIDVSLNSNVDVSHLTIQADGEEYTVGDPESSVYIRIPKEGVEAIKLMKGDKSLNQISNILKQTKDIDVDIVDFVQTLLSLNLVYRIDNITLIEVKNIPTKEGKIKKLGEFFFNPIMYFIYVISFILCIILMLKFKNLVPNYQDYFVFKNSIGLSVLTLFFVSWISTILHETGHYLSARALNVPVSFKISIRWFWVVIEANMNSLWSVEKKKRFIPFLAGMAWDSIILLMALVLQEYYVFSGLLLSILKLIVLLQIYKFAWHLLVFFKTDLYYVFITVANTSNLSKNSILYLKKIFTSKESYSSKWRSVDLNEKKYAKWFSMLYIVGVFTALILFSFYSIPAFLTATFKAISALIQNNWTSIRFWDGAIVIVISLFNLVLWVIGLRNQFKNKKMQQFKGE